MTKDPAPYRMPPRPRRLFCNRTLNMRAIRAVGYDLDYTLVHYKVVEWERRAYQHLRQKLLDRKWPVENLSFEPELVMRGLILDIELGNLLKANRFGYVKKAYHGTRSLPYDEQRKVYARTIVDLSEPRWVFINTLFALSEACMYAQLVDLFDEGKLPPHLGYTLLYRQVRTSLDLAHMEGELKGEIESDPERFIELDPEMPQTLLDQKRAGKKLLLITNSEWLYAEKMLDYTFDRFLPDGMRWRELFDVVIAAAGKPGFFERRRPLYEVVTDDGLLRPCVGEIQQGVAYVGGDAARVEAHLGLSGDQILYVGDHIHVDVALTKSEMRWRTALILRELEEELAAMDTFAHDQAELATLMDEKERLEFEHCQLRLEEVRRRAESDPTEGAGLAPRLAKIRQRLSALDEHISPLAKASAELGNPNWGLLLRTGNDKSHLARQLERHADIYTSRVSNLLYQTPFVYLRSPRGSMPHDPHSLPAPTSEES